MKSIPLLILSLSLLTGCPQPAATIPATPAVALQTAIQAQVSDSDGRPLANVRLRFSYPLETPFERVTDATGMADLKGLKSGVPYLLQVSGTDRVPRQQVVQVPAVVAGKSQPLRLRVVLEQAQFQLSGQITDSAGQPVPAAVIQAGNQSLETGSDGRYSLALALPPGEVSAYKQGYRSCVLSAGSCKLEAASQKPRLRTSAGHQALENVSQQTASLLQDTRNAGLEVLAWPGEDLDPERDTLWLAAPAEPITAAEISQITGFVHAGGKLVVNSEWAGFGKLDLDSLRNLLTGFGLVPGSDTLHQDQRLAIELFEPSHPLLTGVQKLMLYRSGSVQLLQPEHARLLAYTSAGGFRIATSLGGQGVLGCATSGKGKVVLLGDNSLWLDEDSDNNGVVNYREADNARLWKNILSW